ncbi:MAG: PAM68 family protein, partial [Cyanobacteria bacterium J06558_2]
FEPRNNKNNKKDKSAKANAAEATKKAPQKDKAGKASKSTAKKSRASKKSRESNLSTIPDVVSKRMGRRMAVFCGIPSTLGMSSLFIFYWLKIKEIVELPPYAALAVSFAFLVVGVFGLSFGVFSASWDEERVGGIWGIDEFKLNIGRTKAAWKESRNANKKAKAD